MTDSDPSTKRPQSTGEEVANALSHGLGFVAALVAAPILVTAALRHGGTAVVVGFSVFAATTVLLYLSSTLYHALPRNRAKGVFQVLDHSAIFLLIAGTYTPFTLGVMRGAWGWTLLGLVWGIAAAGLVLTALGGTRYPKLSTALYLGMGWLVVIAIKPLLERVPLPGLLWLVAGGLAYSAGVAFYSAKRRRYTHFVWHLFVLTGTVCHFFAVRGYAA
jgi:hemolysin III